MMLQLRRLETVNNAVFGEIYRGERRICACLERFDRIIPAGSYVLSRYKSPRLHQEVILLHDVPGRSMIEIHPANWPHELEGCIAPGLARLPRNNGVAHSVVAFTILIGQVYPQLETNAGVTLEVIGHG